MLSYKWISYLFAGCKDYNIYFLLSSIYFASSYGVLHINSTQFNLNAIFVMLQ